MKIRNLKFGNRGANIKGFLKNVASVAVFQIRQSKILRWKAWEAGERRFMRQNYHSFGERTHTEDRKAAQGSVMQALEENEEKQILMILIYIKTHLMLFLPMTIVEVKLTLGL